MEKEKKPIYKKWWFWVLLIPLALMVIMNIMLAMEVPDILAIEFFIVILVVAVKKSKKGKTDKKSLVENEGTNDRINEIDKQIRDALGKYKLSNRKKINEYLANILQDNEDILAFADGTYENKRINILTTKKRVILFYKGIIRSFQVDIPIEKITSIGHNKGFVTGEIHIWDGSSSKIMIKSVLIEQIDKFVKTTNEIIDNYKSFKIEVNKTVEKDVTDKIEKLATLYKEGILTEYEFTTKKLELLEKLKK